MRRLLFTFSILIFSIVTFHSCTDDRGGVASQRYPVRFDSDITGLATAATRMAGEEWEADDKIGIYMLESGNAALPGLAESGGRPYILKDVDGIYEPVAVHGELCYPIAGEDDEDTNEDVQFTAYYPYTTNIIQDTEHATEHYPINVTGQDYPSIDLLYVHPTRNYNRYGGENVRLAFDHRLTKITFIVNVAEGSANNLTDATATLAGFPREGQCNLATGEVHTTTNPGELSMKTISTSRTSATFEAIIVPHTGKDYTTRAFNIKIGATTYTYELPYTRNFASGTSYIYQLQWRTDGKLTHTADTEIEWNSNSGYVAWGDHILTFTASGISVGSSGGTGSIKLKTNARTIPTFTTSEVKLGQTNEHTGWLTNGRIASTTELEAGWREYNLYCTLAGNARAIARTGYLHVKVGELTTKIKVTQSAAAAQTRVHSTYSTSLAGASTSLSQPIVADGGSNTYYLYTNSYSNPGCTSYSLTSGYPSISLYSTARDYSIWRVTYSVGMNPYKVQSRSGSITYSAGGATASCSISQSYPSMQTAENCYLMTSASTIYIPLDRTINYGAGSSSTFTVEPLWSNHYPAATLIDYVNSGGTIGNGYIRVTRKSTSYSGNVILAVKQGSTYCGTIHIWCPSTTPGSYTESSGKRMMTMNLGAITTGTTHNAVGLYYQWGRPTPFPRPYSLSSSTSFEYVYNGTSTTNSSPGISKGGQAPDLLTAHRNPKTIYTGTLNWLNANNTTLWSSSKTIYDPCPSGWRVPSDGSGNWWSGNGNGTKTSDGNGRYFGNSSYPYVMGGMIDQAAWNNQVGGKGYYWSGQYSGTANGWWLEFGANIASTLSAGRQHCAQIRCTPN